MRLQLGGGRGGGGNRAAIRRRLVHSGRLLYFDLLIYSGPLHF
jgi:hypothetical protein